MAESKAKRVSIKSGAKGGGGRSTSARGATRSAVAQTQEERALTPQDYATSKTLKDEGVRQAALADARRLANDPEALKAQIREKASQAREAVLNGGDVVSHLNDIEALAANLSPELEEERRQVTTAQYEAEASVANAGTEVTTDGSEE